MSKDRIKQMSSKEFDFMNALLGNKFRFLDRSHHYDYGKISPIHKSWLLKNAKIIVPVDMSKITRVYEGKHPLYDYYAENY